MTICYREAQNLWKKQVSQDENNGSQGQVVEYREPLWRKMAGHRGGGTEAKREELVKRKIIRALVLLSCNASYF